MSIEPTRSSIRPQSQPRPGFFFRPRRDARAVHPSPYAARASRPSGEGLALALGWLGVGLGAAQIVAPRAVAALCGVRGRPALMRAVGVREMASGLGILTQRHQAPWLWTRVAGDALDLTLLGTSLTARNRARSRTAAATVAVTAVTLLDVYAGRTRSRAEALAREARGERIPVEASITVNRPPEECYRFWHDFESLPRFMRHLESVQVLDEKRSRWAARSPGGGTVEWISEIVGDTPNERIAWRSLEGADVSNAGVVRFERAPAGRGTVVRVQMQFEPPGGALGTLAARISGETPQRQVQEDLRRFKSVLETGEIATTRGQPSGRRTLIARTFSRRLRESSHES